MALIRPCADLRNNYNEISKICHETNEPIYITKNGTNDLVVLSDEAFDNIIKINQEKEEERIDRLVAEHFDKHYASFKEFKEDIIKNINKALKEIDEGSCRTLDEFCAEMEEKYGLQLRN